MKRNYINGKIFTCEAEAAFDEAFSTENGYITDVGTSEYISSKPADIVVDLEGKTVIPGIIDAHMHPDALAACSRQISCLPPLVDSIEALVSEIREKSKETKEGSWIKGWGYDEGKIKEKRVPTRLDLDRGCSDIPIRIERSCCHISFVNSKALEIAGITKDTPDPEGGRIGRFDDGEPDGVLYEAAEFLLDNFVPKDSEADRISNLTDLGKLLSAHGIAAVTDMGDLDGENIYGLYEKAAEAGFDQDIAVYPMWEHCRGDKSLERLAEEERSSKKSVHFAGLKLISDGSISGHTAYVEEPYLGTSEHGIATCSDEQIISAIEFCKAHKCQLSVHAMGELAIRRILDLVCKEENWMPETKVPHVRLEHVTEPSDDSLKRAAEHGIAFVTQPIFFFSEIESYMTNLGHERTKAAYPINTELKRGVRVCISTDSPATAWADPSDPFINMQAAVTRTAYDGTDCGKEEAIDIQTAVRLYTKEAAEIAGFDELGGIMPGKKASFVVLNKDIFSVPDEEIGTVHPIKMYIGDRLVYEA